MLHRHLWLFTALFIHLSILTPWIAASQYCVKPTELRKGNGQLQVSGTIKCDGKELYGAYVQLVDNFQAVNDVVAHGHTSRKGGYSVSGQYYYYADTDLEPAKGSWQVVIYSYCGIDYEQKNQCHRVHKRTIYDGDGSDCLEYSNGAAKQINLQKDIDIPKLASTADTAHDESHIICLDGRKA